MTMRLPVHLVTGLCGLAITQLQHHHQYRISYGNTQTQHVHASHHNTDSSMTAGNRRCQLRQQNMSAVLSPEMRCPVR